MLHLALMEALEKRFATVLAVPAKLSQDALVFWLDNGVAMEVRFAAADAYDIAWHWGEAGLRIDTTPRHPHLGTFPNHLHDANGEVRADLLTRPGAAPWHNLSKVIEAVLADPLLQSR